MTTTRTTDAAADSGDAQLDAQAAEAEALIARYIQKDRNRPGRDRARVVVGNDGVPVWALIGHLRGRGGIAQVARDYALPEEAVKAAIAYYHRNRELIDARLLLNDEAFVG